MRVPGRDVHAGLDDLEDGSARGAERFVVDERGVDVVVTAEREESVAVVEIQWCLLADPPEHRIRIGVEVDVVRVVVDIPGEVPACAECHRMLPFLPVGTRMRDVPQSIPRPVCQRRTT